MTLTKTVCTSIQSPVESGAASYTTAALSTSPPAGSMVVLLINNAYNFTGAVTVTDNHSNTYSAGPSQSPNAQGNTAIFSFVYATAPGSTTIKVAIAGTAVNYLEITPIIFSGQAASQSGAATLSTNSGTAKSTTMEGSITPTVAGSYIVFVSQQVDVTSSPTVTAATGCTVADHEFQNSWMIGFTGYTTAVTVTPGSAITVGATVSADTGGQGWCICALEILPTPPPVPTDLFFPFFN